MEKIYCVEVARLFESIKTAVKRILWDLDDRGGRHIFYTKIFATLRQRLGCDKGEVYKSNRRTPR